MGAQRCGSQASRGANQGQNFEMMTGLIQVRIFTSVLF